MRLAICAALAAATFLATAASAQVTNYYETFENFVGSTGIGPWGTDANAIAWTEPFGGNAATGFNDVAGYPDDPDSAVQFSSLQNATMQNFQNTTDPIGAATTPYSVSFALQLDDNSSTTGGFVQLLAGNSFETVPGFRTLFQIQLWDEDFLAPGDPSYFVVTPFDPGSGGALLSVTGVPGILSGANGFVSDGSAWNVVIVVFDPILAEVKAWVNPASNAASPDIAQSFTFGALDAPHFLSIGSYTFLPDTTPATERIATIDSLRIISGGTQTEAFEAAFASYSTLNTASVPQWQMY